MTDVVFAGIGQTDVGEHWNISLRELAFAAVEKAVQDSGGLRPQALFVGNMLAPILSHQAHLGALIADFSGLTGIEASTVESGSASGGAALRMGYLTVASGQADVVLVVGVEKFTDQVGSNIEAALASSSDSDYEAVHGLTPTAQAAMLMRRYLHEFNAPREAFAGFAVTAHENGANNPHAMFQKAITADTYLRAGMVCDPINMFDVAPNADGAAAIVLTRPGVLPPNFPHRLVRITSSSLVTDTLSLHDRPDPLTFTAARQSVEKVLSKAALIPRDIDFFELHDAFSIYAALTLEAAGFVARGQGWQMAQDGLIQRDGSLPVATMGGLKARGNPGGATGVYQVVEAVLQLRGEAGKNQLKDPRYGLVQSLGGPASSAATHLLEAL